MCKNMSFEVCGWFMWDKDAENGYQEGFFVGGNNEQKPTGPEDVQKKRDGDHQGHIWDSHPLYKMN